MNKKQKTCPPVKSRKLKKNEANIIQKQVVVETTRKDKEEVVDTSKKIEKKKVEDTSRKIEKEKIEETSEIKGKKRKNDGQVEIPVKKKPRIEKEFEKVISGKNETSNFKYLKDVILKPHFVQFFEKETIDNLKKLKNESEILKFKEENFVYLMSLKDKQNQDVKFPEEILSFFKNISMERTKGNRNTYYGLMSGLKSNYLKGFSYNGSCYKNDKNSPLKLDNIMDASFEKFVMNQAVDPDIIDLTIEQLYFKGIKNFNSYEVIPCDITKLVFCDVSFEKSFKFHCLFEKKNLHLSILEFNKCKMPSIKQDLQPIEVEVENLIFENLVYHESLPDLMCDIVVNIPSIKEIKIINLFINDKLCRSISQLKSLKKLSLIGLKEKLEIHKDNFSFNVEIVVKDSPFITIKELEKKK